MHPRNAIAEDVNANKFAGVEQIGAGFGFEKLDAFEDYDFRDKLQPVPDEIGRQGERRIGHDCRYLMRRLAAIAEINSITGDISSDTRMPMRPERDGDIVVIIAAGIPTTRWQWFNCDQRLDRASRRQVAFQPAL
jgi:hypothetical protein